MVTWAVIRKSHLGKGWHVDDVVSGLHYAIPEVDAVAEVFVEFAEPVAATDGEAYIARACGGEDERGHWQGWLEFTPTSGGATVRSGRETTQPNRADTEYWATGLSRVYLEGAIERSLKPLAQAPGRAVQPPAFTAPAPPANHAPVNSAVLNPFSVYRKGEALLRGQLQALSAWHLVNIVTAYELTDESAAALSATPASVLIELIVSGVRERSLLDSAR